MRNEDRPEQAAGKHAPAPTRGRAWGRVVVKIGSGVVAPDGALDQSTFDRLAADVEQFVQAGADVAIVSSGAVAGGFRSLGRSRMPATIVEKQAAAAIGQHRLMQCWAKAFTAHGRHVAQILLTADDLHHRGRFINARHTLSALFEAGIVPIVNENDTVSFDEIKVGDNDQLSALVANLIDAELLVLLSVADGVRDGGTAGAVIPVVHDAAEALRHAEAVKSATGVGGMQTKLRAAETATMSGCAAVVASGRTPGVLDAIMREEGVGTMFPRRRPAAAARKRWIGHSARPRGVITIDAGAADALSHRGASLLPSGVVDVRGEFQVGDAVSIATTDGAVVARGIASYSAQDVARIKGCKSSQIQSALGYVYCEEIIHRNDLVLADRRQDSTEASA